MFSSAQKPKTSVQVLLVKAHRIPPGAVKEQVFGKNVDYQRQDSKKRLKSVIRIRRILKADGGSNGTRLTVTAVPEGVVLDFRFGARASGRASAAATAEVGAAGATGEGAAWAFATSPGEPYLLDEPRTLLSIDE